MTVITDTTTTPLCSRAKIWVFRLRPLEDLKQSLLRFAIKNKIQAAVIMTCVGSLKQYHVRFANQQDGSLQEGYFEIVSLVGTLSHASAHLHICLSDKNGMTIGGHLLEGNLVYTTAEIAIAELPDLEFHRTLDPQSGYPELVVRQGTGRPAV